MNAKTNLKGTKHVLLQSDEKFPDALRSIPRPPECIYAIGSANALQGEGVAIIGARRATPYGCHCANQFGKLLAERGLTLVSGGARGCDTSALEAFVQAGGKAVVVLGSGCDSIYPHENTPLFQRVIFNGGTIISEQEWDAAPLPYMFRARNRLIAGLSKAVLIVEAGLPSGTFSTADDALEAGKEVLAIPGPISSQQSSGANKLIYQGATPIIDEETFNDKMIALFGCV